MVDQSIGEEPVSGGIRGGSPGNTAAHGRKTTTPSHIYENSCHASSAKKKEVAWPKWDGSNENFAFLIHQMQVKIEEDLHLLGTSRAICLGMIATLPDEKKPRVAQWFMRGGENEAYDWRDFINHFHDEFEDKQARIAAGYTLSRMRQGSQQYFHDFLQDFEHKLTQCGGDTWGSAAKVIYLNAGIYDTLRDALIPAKLPSYNDYARWVAEVYEVASKLEARSGYQPKGSRATKSWFEVRPGTNPTSAREFTKTQTDSDGDTLMSGVNALLASLAQERSRKGGDEELPSKPRAPWRSKEDFKRLKDNGLCVRCGRAGHISYRCPTHRPAKRCGTGLSAVELTSEFHDQHVDSGNGVP